jgi:RNA polymerase sigma factor (sigma-70 family)
VEVSALTQGSNVPALRGPSPLLRLQSDERLIALTRRGQHAAFEALCARYQARLLSFVRHMLGSREDAEDVLQEVFAAAFNAVLADEREINVRPWLYRIARNRSLNHLRRASAVGVDSMDVHFADFGLSTGERVLRRESFRELLDDVRALPETQRTALLLREIDALSYEQIAQAMETTVPSVKSLLVRARISLAEAAEARKLNCGEVRLELGEAAEGLVKVSAPARRHVRDCTRCRTFKRQLRENNQALAAIFPVGPLLLLKKLFLAKLGSASSAHVASGAGATVGASAAAGAGAAGGAGAGGVFTVGAGAIATKAVAGLAAAAIVSAGAMAANQSSPRRHAAAARHTYLAVTHRAYEPVVAAQSAQPIGAGVERPASAVVHHFAHMHAAAIKAAHATVKKAAPASVSPASALPVSAPPAPASLAPASPAPTAAVPLPAAQSTPPPITQLTSEATQLPASATAAPGQTTAGTPAGPETPTAVSQTAPVASAPAPQPTAGTPVPAGTPVVAPVTSSVKAPAARAVRLRHTATAHRGGKSASGLAAHPGKSRSHATHRLGAGHPGRARRR